MKLGDRNPALCAAARDPLDSGADRVQRDGPREQEGDLEIEHDEEDGDEVVAHVEFHARVLECLEAALVWRQLGGVGTVRRKEVAEHEQEDAESACDCEKDQDRQVLREHLSGQSRGGFD